MYCALNQRKQINQKITLNRIQNIYKLRYNRKTLRTLYKVNKARTVLYYVKPLLSLKT